MSPTTLYRFLHCLKVAAISDSSSIFFGLEDYWELMASPNIPLALRSNRLQVFYRTAMLKLFGNFIGLQLYLKNASITGFSLGTL